MMEKSNSQYESFLFWRQPIPALDLSELEELDVAIRQSTNGSAGKGKASKLRSRDDETALLQFSSFNYWRAPIADVDTLLADLNLLL
ncbi:protein AF1q [Solea solea]|uniref:protein AF1q n=1 Tax=Solea solea TaxID=90069 RepID=UPI00272D8C21|nr:protein AF1q [Solea solea]